MPETDKRAPLRLRMKATQAYHPTSTSKDGETPSSDTGGTTFAGVFFILVVVVVVVVREHSSVVDESGASS